MYFFLSIGAVHGLVRNSVYERQNWQFNYQKSLQS